VKAGKIHTPSERARQFFLVEAILNTILQPKPNFKWTSDRQKDLDILDSLLSVFLPFEQQSTCVQALKSVKTFQTVLSKNTQNAHGGDLCCIVVSGKQQWSYYPVKVKNSVKVTSISNCKAGLCD